MKWILSVSICAFLAFSAAPSFAVPITFDFTSGNDGARHLSVDHEQDGLRLTVTAGGYDARNSGGSDKSNYQYSVYKDSSNPPGYGVCTDYSEGPGCGGDVAEVDGLGDEALFFSFSRVVTLTGIAFVDGDHENTAFDGDKYDVLIDDKIARDGFINFDIPNGGLVTDLTFGPSTFFGLGAEKGRYDNWYVSSITVTVEPVPEPATLLLVGAGLIGVVGARRKFTKK